MTAFGTTCNWVEQSTCALLPLLLATSKWVTHCSRCHGGNNPAAACSNLHLVYKVRKPQMLSQTTVLVLYRLVR